MTGTGTDGKITIAVFGRPTMTCYDWTSSAKEVASDEVTGDVDGLDMQAVIGADVGAGKGPSDLSTNRKRLSGYGRTRTR